MRKGKFMDQNIKKSHLPAFKAKIALEAIKEAETPGQIASRFAIHPIQVGIWKRMALEAIGKLFRQDNAQTQKEKDDEREDLYRSIGKLKVENDFLKKKVGILE